MTQLHKGHDERTQMNSEISTYTILLALKIATLSMYHQHKNKLIGRFIVWFGVVPVFCGVVNGKLYKRNSPVGIPNSLLPLPKPLTTSPRQKYGGKLVTMSEGISVPKYQSTKQISVEFVMFVSRAWETADQKTVLRNTKKFGVSCAKRWKIIRKSEVLSDVVNSNLELQLPGSLCLNPV